MQRRKVSLPSRRGHMLAGRLDIPRQDPPRAWAILAHCFTCTKDLKAFYHLGAALAEAGLGVLRVDFTGLGESEGRFEQTDLATNVEDLLAAADYLASLGAAPGVLVGHSLGGTACLLASRQLWSIRALVTLGTAADPLHLMRIFPAARQTAAEHGTATVRVGEQDIDVSERLFRDLEALDLEALVRGLAKPLLVAHATADEIVPIAHGERIFDWAPHPKAFVSLPQADHVLSDSAQAAAFGALIGAWVGIHLRE